MTMNHNQCYRRPVLQLCFRVSRWKSNQENRKEKMKKRWTKRHLSYFKSNNSKWCNSNSNKSSKILKSLKLVRVKSLVHMLITIKTIKLFKMNTYINNNKRKHNLLIKANNHPNRRNLTRSNMSLTKMKMMESTLTWLKSWSNFNSSNNSKTTKMTRNMVRRTMKMLNISSNSNKWWCNNKCSNKCKVKKTMTRKRETMKIRPSLNLMTSMTMIKRCFSNTCNKSMRRTLISSPSLKSCCKETSSSNNNHNPKRKSQSEISRAKKWLSKMLINSKMTKRIKI